MPDDLKDDNDKRDAKLPKLSKNIANLLGKNPKDERPNGDSKNSPNAKKDAEDNTKSASDRVSKVHGNQQKSGKYSRSLGGMDNKIRNGKINFSSPEGQRAQGQYDKIQGLKGNLTVSDARSGKDGARAYSDVRNYSAKAAEAKSSGKSDRPEAQMNKNAPNSNKPESKKMPGSPSSKVGGKNIPKSKIARDFKPAYTKDGPKPNSKTESSKMGGSSKTIKISSSLQNGKTGTDRIKTFNITNKTSHEQGKKEGGQDPGGSGYNNKWGPDKSLIAPNARGATSGGTRPLGPSYAINRTLNGKDDKSKNSILVKTNQFYDGGSKAQGGDSKTSGSSIKTANVTSKVGNIGAKGGPTKTSPDNKAGGKTDSASGKTNTATGVQKLMRGSGKFELPSSPRDPDGPDMGSWENRVNTHRGTHGLAEGWAPTSRVQPVKGPMVAKNAKLANIGEKWNQAVTKAQGKFNGSKPTPTKSGSDKSSAPKNYSMKGLTPKDGSKGFAMAGSKAKSNGPAKTAGSMKTIDKGELGRF